MGPSPTGDGESRVRGPTAARSAASMGPSPTGDGEDVAGLHCRLCLFGLQWGRRQQATERPRPALRRRTRRRFNGAVANRRRREQLGRAGRMLASAASMGPSPTGDGEVAIACGFAPTRNPLQWGRRQQATESDGMFAIVLAKAALQWGRRQQATERLRTGEKVSVSHFRFNGAVANRRRRVREGADPVPAIGGASMGPSPTGDGEAVALASEERCRVALQWGRRQQATESCKHCDIGHLDTPLQWGRRQQATERRTNARRRSSRTWRLQWGRRQQATESTRQSPSTWPTRPCASMGPSPTGDGEPEWRGRRRPPLGCFNGAVANRRRRVAGVSSHNPRNRLASMGPSPTGDGELGCVLGVTVQL